MKYVITLDLDGTLLEDNKQLSDKTVKVLKSLKDRGHKVVIATGRPVHGAYPFYKQLELDTPLITDNGSLISNPSDPNFMILRKTIPMQIFKDMYQSIGKYLAAATINQDNKVYAFNYNEDFEVTFNGVPAKEVFEMDLIDLDFEPMNLAVLVNSENREAFEAYFKTKSITARFWGEHNNQAFYDIHLRHVSKATAISDVLSYYQMSRDNLITIGDGPNDTEMLELTAFGTAMANANDYIKSYASYITEHDNNNNGVALYLKAFFNL